LAITRCKFLANGNEASLGTVLMIVDQGRLTIIDSDISINWGGMLLLLRLKAGSRIDSTTLDVNFNSPVSSMVTVNNCADTLTITNSSISHNLGTLYWIESNHHTLTDRTRTRTRSTAHAHSPVGGALRVAGCHAEMRNSMVWGQSTFGAICGALASIDATTSSIFRCVVCGHACACVCVCVCFCVRVRVPQRLTPRINGTTPRNGYKRENFANRYRDALCGGCLGFSIASDPNICTNAINITDIGGMYTLYRLILFFLKAVYNVEKNTISLTDATTRHKRHDTQRVYPSVANKGSTCAADAMRREPRWTAAIATASPLGSPPPRSVRR
jgi:hypothetical protein